MDWTPPPSSSPAKTPPNWRSSPKISTPSTTPREPVETELVEIIVRSTWLRHRYFRIEAQLYQSIFKKLDDPEATLGDAFLYDASGPNVLGKLFRRQSAAQRDFNKALADLRRLQEARTELEMFQAAAPPPLPADSPGTRPRRSRGPSRIPIPPLVERTQKATRTRPPQPLFDNLIFVAQPLVPAAAHVDAKPYL